MTTKKRTRTAEPATATLDPTLPDNVRPLVWGAWPSPDARIRISGVRGVWSFAAHLTRYVAPLERVFVLEDRAEEGAR